MRPRYFMSYFDDTLNGLYHHQTGELAGRKPVVFSFLNQKPKPNNGKIGASVRLGKALIGKLKGMGIK